MKRALVALLITVFMICSATAEKFSLTTISSTLSVSEETIYADGEGIQAFLSAFNKIYPEYAITSDMLSKYRRGVTHDDTVLFSINDCEITLSSDWDLSNGYRRISVFIKNPDTFAKKNKNVRIKELFFKFAKVFDNALTDEVLEKYWAQQSSGEISSHLNKYDTLECQSSVFYGAVEYIKITGQVAIS